MATVKHSMKKKIFFQWKCIVKVRIEVEDTCEHRDKNVKVF